MFWLDYIRNRRFRAVRRLYGAVRNADSPEARARRLLRRWLSAEQCAQFDGANCFEVVGRTTRNRYRIHYGISVNVHQLDSDGSPRIGWCFAPIGNLAAGDVMLAQKIALETDELAALRKANNFASDLYPLRGVPRHF